MIVKYSKKFPYAPYLNEDIGFEMEINTVGFNNDMVQETLKVLKGMAEQFHKDNNPQLQHEAPFVYSQDPLPLNGTTPHVQPFPVRNLAAERVEILIEQATNLEELWAYEDDATKYGLSTQYQIKLQSFLL